MQLKGGRHFSYCLNVHPGESLESILSVIRTKVPEIKQALSPDRPFGLGLRIAKDASMDLKQPGMLPLLRKEMADADCYTFTLNGFPFGAFHQTRVKEQVYQPDWSSPERLTYTQDLFLQLAKLLPPETEGSVSTVPLGYKFDASAPGQRPFMVQQLRNLAFDLDQLQKETGKYLHLGLEPEPDCILETTAEAVRFFKEELYKDTGKDEELIRRHIGICLDTCHVAMQFEDPEETVNLLSREGIRISKTQISAALECDAGIDPGRLNVFDDGVYLHQIKSQHGRAWQDVPHFLSATDRNAGTIRIHAHVPLHWSGDDELRSTRHTLTPGFWKALAQSDCTHFEVETYTFDVLPASIRAGRSVSEDMIAECQWALAAIER